jgi:hypothetical protein
MYKVASALVLLASPAWATSEFPTAIKSHLGLSATPPESCGLCHRNNVLGAGTVTTPFGTSMRMRGLMPNDNASLTTALNRMDTDRVDSDGDTVTDIAELRAGTSPNVAQSPDGGAGGGTGEGTGGGGGETVPDVRFGCGANAVPGGSALAALLMVSRLRRRR